MTSAFGGIILIAILVALVSREAKKATPNDRIAEANAEMLERRIATAEKDLVATEGLRSDLKTKLSVAEVSELAALIQMRDRLRAELDATQRKLSELAQSSTATATNDPSELLKTLTRELRELQRQQAAEANNNRALMENLERLKGRMNDLAVAMSKDRDQHTRKVRLPKERSKAKTAFNFIIRFNEVYPLQVVGDGESHLNEKSLKWEFLDNKESAKVQPIRGAGWDIQRDRPEIVRLLKSIPAAEYYVASYVYGDSFATFNEFKRLTIDAGLDYGWEPEGTLSGLVFGKNGTSPPPL
jgi:hypothetical protein